MLIATAAGVCHGKSVAEAYAGLVLYIPCREFSSLLIISLKSAKFHHRDRDRDLICSIGNQVARNSLRPLGFQVEPKSAAE